MTFKQNSYALWMLRSCVPFYSVFMAESIKKNTRRATAQCLHRNKRVNKKINFTQKSCICRGNLFKHIIPLWANTFLLITDIVYTVYLSHCQLLACYGCFQTTIIIKCYMQLWTNVLTLFAKYLTKVQLLLLDSVCRFNIVQFNWSEFCYVVVFRSISFLDNFSSNHIMDEQRTVTIRRIKSNKVADEK